MTNLDKHQPLNALADFTKVAATETIVLLKNNNNVLPLDNKNVALFGRIQSYYYKSGTGSGGLVNVKEVPSILDVCLTHPSMTIDLEVKKVYEEWLEEHPYDAGNGQWASEPWAQEEMIISELVVKEASLKNEIALVVLGRTAGEDKDFYDGPGSYQLSENEKDLLSKVKRYFKNVVVVLNIGNMMDLEFAEKYDIDGLVIAWHGGMYGARALVDVLTGFSTPSGKLPMTVVKDIQAFPSNKYFGNHHESIYDEDIYVGYRYFETFDQNAVRYPFGFGLSYTTFSHTLQKEEKQGTKITFSISVKNTGKVDGKEVTSIYLKQPQGKLGKPSIILVGYKKTNTLKPGESQVLSFDIDLKDFASYDDEGLIKVSSYILEKGTYELFYGTHVRNNKKAIEVLLNEDIIVSTLSENMAPVKPFKRLKPTTDLKASYQDTPLRKVDYDKRMNQSLKKPLVIKKNELQLADVYTSKVNLDDFISTLSVSDLIELTRGEGMSSPKVTPGTAAAFGGVTESLKNKGIPVCCAADGPSGIRMDSGAYASSMPSGTALASSFNNDLVLELYRLTGLEMRAYDVDALLGPGLNIMRHPLNGRNFEYFSEDPYLTGMMATQVIKGLHLSGVDGTLKHFACNNQETDRFNVDAVVSERALREIYLKGFEIAVKQANASLIMTSYNPINGLWSASNYELTKRILRDEWQFKGLVMTDWWAKMNDFGTEGNKQNTKAMIKAQNDLYMVVENSKDNSSNDNAFESYQENHLSLYELQEVARHILTYILTTPAFMKIVKKDELLNIPKPRHKQLKEIVINEKKYQLNDYQNKLEINHIEKIVTISPQGLISHDGKHAIIKYEDIIYDVYLKNNIKMKNSIETIDSISIVKMERANWTSKRLPFENIVDKTKDTLIENDMITLSGKNNTFTYALDIVESGKYIFDIEIKVDALELAQVPFSIYVDEKHELTLTLRSTRNNFIIAKGFVILQEGKQLVKFKFNNGGIIIKSITCIKHG